MNKGSSVGMQGKDIDIELDNFEGKVDRYGGIDYRLVEHMLHPLPRGLESPWLGSLHLFLSWLSLAVYVFRDPLFA